MGPVLYCSFAGLLQVFLSSLLCYYSEEAVMMKRERPSVKQGSIKRLLTAAAVFALLSAAVYLDAWLGGPFSRLFYPGADYLLLGAIGRISGLFPFSLFEALCAGLTVCALINLALSFRKKRGFLRFLSAALAIALGLTFCFTFLWGVNHFGEDLYTRLEMAPADYTAEDLYNAGACCAQMANTAIEALPENPDGTAKLPDLKTLAASAAEGFGPLSSVHEKIYMPLIKPKALLFSDAFSYMGFTGFYFCYTGEACANRNTYPSALPLTLCHELGHSICVASEDEANFIAFLACLENGRPEFVYSAWYLGYIWCVNSLYKIDKKAASRLSALCSDRFRTDLNSTNTHYEQYDGQVQEAAQSVNDAYLKAYQEELGVESYDAAVSYLVSWYLAGCPLYTVEPVSAK